MEAQRHWLCRQKRNIMRQVGKVLQTTFCVAHSLQTPPPFISLYFSFLTPNLPRSVLLLLIFLAPVLNSPHFLSNSCLLFQFALSFHLSFHSQCLSITNRNSLHPSLLSTDILCFEELCPHLFTPPSCSSALAECFPVSLILISTN